MSSVRRVLLLNPPGSRRYLRDNYCSHVSKGRYFWHPYDLLAQTGHLAARFEVEVLDCIAEEVSPEECRRRVGEGGYDAVVFVTGLVSYREDLPFVRSLRNGSGPLLVGSGEVLLHQRDRVLAEYGVPDAVMEDYTTPELAEWLADPRPGAVLGAMAAQGKWFRLPRPRHELFRLERYHLPQLQSHPFASLLIGFGCPYRCSFCPFERLPYKLRPVEDLVEELRHLAGIGIRELWIKDQTFGVNRRHTMELFRRMKAEGLRFSWSCECRCDLLDEEMVREMRRAGCHTVMLGVESASQAVLDRYRKDLDLARVEPAFRLCREYGIRTLAHFCLGLPGETRESMQRLVDFALRLDPDYVSFNLAEPMAGTGFHDEALAEGWISPEEDCIDNSCSFPVMRGPDLTPEEVWEFHRQAQRRFFLRPAWLARRLAGVRSAYEASNLAREGAGMLARVLGG